MQVDKSVVRSTRFSGAYGLWCDPLRSPTAVRNVIEYVLKAPNFQIPRINNGSIVLTSRVFEYQLFFNAAYYTI